MTTIDSKQLSRRGFLAGGALLGAGLPALVRAQPSASQGSALLVSDRPDARYELVDPEHHILSSCLQCNTGCSIRCKVQDGVITKIDGNPYSPWTLLPHLPYATKIDDAAPVDGALCPKGQAGLQTLYDPYRLRKVLKRAGQRGENKWTTITFADAVKEITEGGALFAQVPGEETRQVEGLRSLRALTDKDVAKAMAEDVKAIHDAKGKDKKAELVAAFKDKHKAHLHTLIDPDHPDLGPKNNQIVCSWGRLKGGRSEFYKRFADGLGTTNAHGHTTVCQGSLYFTCKAISEQYIAGKFSEGQKFYWQADTENSEFILFVGANLFEANYGPPNRTMRLTGNLVSGKTKIAVVDPRFSKLASKAWKWLPLKPGSDAALAMAIMRFIIDEKRYDAASLACANKAAALAIKESSWTNGTHLVVVKDGKPGANLRAADVMIDGVPLRAAEERMHQDKPYQEKFLVVMVEGKPVAVDPNDDKNAVMGDLFVDAKLPDGTHVKSGLQLLLEQVHQKTLPEWAAIAGVDEGDVLAVAYELTSHGKKAAVDIHRGPAQHTNGFYNVLSWMAVNMLIGNFDAKGGLIKPTTYDANGKGKGELFDTTAHPGVAKGFGISSIRHGVDYEKTTLFAGYPAKRNWYPLSSDIYQEIIPSIGDAYPYPVKCLFLYMGAPTYALPAGHTNIEVLRDVKRLPLFIANDILVGSTSMYADYIFPDLTFLERWELQGSHPNIANKVAPVRQPAVAPIPEDCTVFGQQIPLSFEAMLLGLAESLGLPGFGPKGFGEGKSFQHPDDLYLRQVANIAFGEKPDGSQNVPDADERELAIFAKSRTHLPKSVFDPARWKAIVGDKMWPKVVYVLNRGGRFEDHAKGYKGERVAHAYGKQLNLYQEKTAKTIHSGTGEHHPGTAAYIPVRDYGGNEPTQLREGHDLALITHRVISQTKSRTIADPWLSALMPENGVLIHPSDAERLGLVHGQAVKVTSATNPSGEWDLGPMGKKPMVGKLILTQTVRPGVVSFALGFGHWATGAAAMRIDGHDIRADERRQRGLHANAAMWIDPVLKNTCMLDPVGGSVSFYDSFIRLVPA